MLDGSLEDGNAKKIKVGLVCGSGGHYTQIKLIGAALKDFNCFYITTDSINPHESNNTYYFREIRIKHRVDLIKIFFYYLLIFAGSLRILLKEKPDIIVSSGGGPPIPMLYAGKILGIKLIFIESSTRFKKPSVTGRLVYPIVNKLYVQNPELLDGYGRKAEYHGGLV